MIWIIRTGLALVSLLTVAFIIWKPTEFSTWIMAILFVVVLAVISEGERLHERGLKVIPSYSKHPVFWSFGFAIFCATVAILNFMREGYLVAVLNTFATVIFVVLGVLAIVLMPKEGNACAHSMKK